MELRTSFLTPGKPQELLAVIDVEHDSVEPGQEGQVRRRVVGTVREFGEGWERFVRGQPAVAEPDGDYIVVEKVHVDHDFYPFRSLLAIRDLPTIRLIVAEHFSGSDEDYFDDVRARNAARQAYLDAWHKPSPTRNDIRELLGLPRRPEASLDQPVPAQEVETIRELHFRMHGPFWNLIT